MSRKLKILSTLSEAEMQADYTQVLEGLAIKGHEVYTFLNSPTTTWDPGIPSLKIFPTKEILKLDRLSLINSLSLRAANCIQKYYIDVIYATGTRLGEGLVAGTLTRKPILCDVRNPWSIQWKDFRKGISMRTFVGHTFRRIRKFSEEKLIHKADILVAYSRGIKQWLVSSIGLESDKITVIPPHVDTAKFNPKLDPTKVRNKYGLGNDFLLMYLGAITHSRGMDILVEALHRLNYDNVKVNLMLVGPLHDSVRPYINGLRSKIRALGLTDNVMFTGYVPFEEVPEYVAATDICVVPHRPNFTYEISPPVKILEYMASQKPVVTTNVGIGDFIKDGETGLIVEPDNPMALAEAIDSLLKNSAFAAQIARNARTFVEKHLREELMIDKFEKVLTSIVHHEK
jgi:glycosyltransferase involved in cell wall biosynthesis